jgi:hypothetical protein
MGIKSLSSCVILYFYGIMQIIILLVSIKFLKSPYSLFIFFFLLLFLGSESTSD